MEFNIAEKLAIFKAIDEVITADGQVASGEISLLKRLMELLKFDRNLLTGARDIDAKEALLILGAMPANKKKALAILLEEMANADGKVDDKEIGLIFRIFEDVGITLD